MIRARRAGGSETSWPACCCAPGLVGGGVGALGAGLADDCTGAGGCTVCWLAGTPGPGNAGDETIPGRGVGGRTGVAVGRGGTGRVGAGGVVPAIGAALSDGAAGAGPAPGAGVLAWSPNSS